MGLPENIDALLVKHDLTQEALFGLLLEKAKELEVQIVFTTHSFQLIERALARRGRGNDVEVVYLRRRDSGIEQVDRPSELDIEADLSVRMPKRSPKKKVEVLCEDDETKWFLKKVLPARTYSKCNVISAGLSCGELAELAIRDIPSLENDLFVVDGDATKDANAKVKGSRRLCVLPTGDKNPEMAIYDALSTLPDDGEFWTSMESAYRYSRQMFIRSYEESHEDHYEDKKKKRRADKEWFRAEKARGGLGENGTDGFNQWKAQHQDECERFADDFLSRVERIIRRVEAMAKRAESE